MATQNLTEYTLILNVKQIFKELLKDKLQKVKLIDLLPTDKSQLPCLIISCMDCKLQPVGVGGIIGTKVKEEDKVELGIIEGARLLGTFKFDVWVKKEKDNIEKLEQIAKVIMDTIGENGLSLRKKGILDISLEKITALTSSKNESTWQLKDEELKKSLDYHMLYEATSFKEPTAGVIKKIDLEIIKDGFKEKMVVGEKV